MVWLGTRLRSITHDVVPKPMVPVDYAGSPYPFLQYLLANVYEQGVRDLIFCVGHLADRIESYFGDGSHYGLTIRYDDTGSHLTASRIRHAMNRFDLTEVLVHCGDVYHPLKLAPFYEHFQQHPDNLVQVSVINTTTPNAYSLGMTMMTLNGDNQVAAVQGNQIKGKQGVIEAGILAVRKDLLPLIGDSSQVDLAHDIYPILIQNNVLGAYPTESVFFDIGTPYEYHRFCSFVADGHAQPLMPNERIYVKTT